MNLLENSLRVKKSTIPGAGKGLFTTVDIPKGTKVIEYKGEVVTWKQIENMPDERNGYVFYFNSRYCLDAWNSKSPARYANDAMGITRVEGLKNNSHYETEKKRCYLVATRNIPKNSEILVSYGAEYWRAIRQNIRQEEKDNGKATLPHHKEKQSKKK